MRKRILMAVLTALASSAVAAEPRTTVVPPAVPYAATPLPLGDVKLTGGPLKAAQDADVKYLLGLEPDRMLARLRIRAKLQPKAKPYDGWDGDGRSLAGHLAGHYLSAISLMYAVTGDAEFKKRADYIVDELKVVQDARGTGYIGAQQGHDGRTGRGPQGKLIDGELLYNRIGEGDIDRDFDLNGMWAPWYTQHKIFAGLRDAYRHTGNKTALAVQIRFATWCETLLAPLNEQQMQYMLDAEFGGMNETFADLYADTGDTRWRTMAERFTHKKVIDPLARGENVLGGLHGNTQVPKFVGALAEHVYTANPAAGDAAKKFFDFVVSQHTFATGGHGYDEYFGPPGKLSGQVDGTGQRSGDLRTSESCNVYNMLKLARRLYALTGDAKYADFHERALFNHVLASMNPATGRTCYMVPVGPGVVHEYQRMHDDFTCCVGTGMESHALHGDGLYATVGNKFIVNLYAPSTAEWRAKGVTITCDTAMPLGDTATFRVSTKTPNEFALSLRWPAWAGRGFAVSINGTPVGLMRNDSGRYIHIPYTCQDGDTVTVTLPHTLHAEPLPDNPHRVALMYGPLVLAGDFGEQTFTDQAKNASANPEDFPVFAHGGEPLADWLKPVDGKPGTFRATTAQGREMMLVPLYTLHDRRYGCYWDVFTPAEWAERQTARAAEQARQKQFAAATVAFVQIGQMQPERDFDFKDDGTGLVRDGDQPGRGGGKWLSVAVPLDPAKPTILTITTTAGTAAGAIDLTVDGLPVVGPPTRTADPAGRFADLSYAVPADAVKGKAKAIVRLAALDGKMLPAVFGLRVLRGD